MSQCKVRTEPERISGKRVEVMKVGERQAEKSLFFNGAVNC